MSVSVKNLTRLASPETGNATLWHYVTSKDPNEDGYFNPAYQLFNVNDVILTIINLPDHPGHTVFLTVTESSRDGVKVRLPIGDGQNLREETPMKKLVEGKYIDADPPAPAAEPQEPVNETGAGSQVTEPQTAAEIKAAAKKLAAAKKADAKNAAATKKAAAKKGSK